MPTNSGAEPPIDDAHPEEHPPLEHPPMEHPEVLPAPGPQGPAIESPPS